MRSRFGQAVVAGHLPDPQQAMETQFELKFQAPRLDIARWSTTAQVRVLGKWLPAASFGV